MNIDEIKIPHEAVVKVCAILELNYGNPDFKTLSDQHMNVFLATAIEAAYRIGFIDGHAHKTGESV